MKPENKIIVNCREATQLEQMRKEGKIAFKGRFALWVHLLYCKFCRLFVKQTALLEKQLKDLAIDDKKYKLSAERKEAIKKALEQ